MYRLLSLVILLSSATYAQNYWQQEVNYKIQVKLDDKNHSLSAYEEFEYINKSPNSLDTIYIHLWPNAYRNAQTALAKQQYGDKNDVSTFCTEEDRGFIDSLDFKVNGVKVNWAYDPENIDICYLVLASPLQPGKSVKISTPFYVKVPSGKISRLGHIGESYQITQWYPKPAVYDARGWNRMPYLNQGEFYSEYGSFDVEITLPENYVVGATGDLQTESEIAFLNKRADETMASVKNGTNYKEFESFDEKIGFPASSGTFKTIRYTQSNVHDFAWFADKRFNVLKSEVELPHSKRKVTSWAMYTKRNAKFWIKASEYLNDAVYYYSLWNGDYPYNNVTAVDGTISAGGGMEYPNVTVIGGSSTDHELEVVIVHEVGHNWFYGQLGSNERVHGWMDEGMNTLNEVRYIQTKYPGNTALSDMVLNGSFHFNDLGHHDMSDISYRLIASIGEDQPIETHSAEFTPANYGIIMYQKTGLVFFYLKDYLGEELFDKCMRAYYAEWEFKHPQPEDMKRSLEKASGKDLGWLFNDLIQTTNHVDFKLKHVKSSENGCDVTVKNTGQVDGPVEVGVYKDGQLVETQWIEPGNRKNTIHFNQNGIDQVRIDPGIDIPELNRQNNSWNKGNLINRCEKMKWEFLIGDNEPEFTNVFWTPMIAGNKYDGLMLGATVHNYGVPFNKFNYLIAPFYSFNRKFVSGTAEFSYTLQPKKLLKMSRFGLSAKSYKNDTTYRANESFYVTLAPYWTAKLGNRGDRKSYVQTIRIQGLLRYDQYGTTSIKHQGIFGEYEFSYSKPDHLVSSKIRNEYLSTPDAFVGGTNSYSRLTTEATYKFRYMKNKMKRWVEIRGFLGYQYMNTFYSGFPIYQYSMGLSGSSGSQDWFTEDYFFGRNETNGFWSQQRMDNMGGFKTSSTVFSNKLMYATNLYFQLPVKTGLLGVFMDAGGYSTDSQGTTITSDFMLNTGIAIKAGDILGVYFPLWMSDSLISSFGTSTNMYDDYLKKIRITLHLNLINKPINLSSLL